MARAMQQAEVIPELTVGGSTSSAHPTDGGSTSVQAPGPALAATAVPAPAPLAPCADAPAASLEGVSGVTASTVSSASPSCAFLLGVRSVLGMWESGLLLADEALSRVVSSLANFRTISSPVGVTSAPQAELPQAGWASALAGTASMPVTSTAPAFPPGIPLPAGQLRTQRLRAVAADPVVAPTKTASSEAPAAPPGKLVPAGPPRPRRLGAVATLPAATLAHPTFSSEMYGRRVRFTCLQVSSHLNGQHGIIAGIRSCDGALLFDVELQAAVERSAQPKVLRDLRPDDLVLVPRAPSRIFGVTWT